MKRFGVIAAWVIATFVTAMVAWSAVDLAGDQVSDRPVMPLSSAEVEALPAGGPSSPADPPSTTAPLTTAPPTSVVPTTSATAPAASTTVTTSAAAATTPASGPSATTTTGATTTSTTSTTSVASTTSTSATPTSTTTGATAPEVTAYSLIGGVVSIEAGPGGVELVSASPRAGFSADIKSSGPGQVEVEFESAGHESRFRARWEGELIVDIDEESEGDSDD